MHNLIPGSLFALRTYLYMLFKENKIYGGSDATLVIQLGVIGDSIIYLAVIRALMRAGVKPTVLCRTSMYDFIRENIGDTEIIAIDIDNGVHAGQEYIDAFRLLKDRKFKRILVLDSQKWGGTTLHRISALNKKYFHIPEENSGA